MVNHSIIDVFNCGIPLCYGVSLWCNVVFFVDGVLLIECSIRCVLLQSVNLSNPIVCVLSDQRLEGGGDSSSRRLYDRRSIREEGLLQFNTLHAWIHTSAQRRG